MAKTAKALTAADVEADLANLIASCHHDPLRFVTRAFPWKEAGSELALHDGPDAWQRAVLCEIRDGLKAGKDPIQTAVASGHGVGKSTLVAWLILWTLATHEDAKAIVTANTEIQLRTKTWPELSHWYNLFIARHWFIMTATSIYSSDPRHERTWRADAIPWSENRTESFAGLHNQGRRVALFFDEASAIPDVIWETASGALTDKDTEIIWGAFGNPTRNTGRFRECFGRFRHRWRTHQIDSRTAKLTNKEQIAQWIADYGEDSDFVRVRVRGVFPRAGSMQFISSELAEEAARREDPETTLMDALVMGVDVARFGDDETVIQLRRGRDGRSIPTIRLRGADTMTVAARVAEAYQEHRPDAIFIDGGGPGAGVVDRLRMLRYPVIEIQFGAAPDRTRETQDGAIAYANKRAEMWGSLRDWLRHGSIPNDPQLLADLCGVEYGYTLREGRDVIILEKKADMKKRGLSSPDWADALALTLALPVQPSDHSHAMGGRVAHSIDYKPFGSAYKQPNQPLGSEPRKGTFMPHGPGRT
jgi:hypothetical protein